MLVEQKTNILIYCQGVEQGRLLKHHANPHRIGRVFDQSLPPLACYINFAAIGGQQSGNNSQNGRFPGA